MGQVPIETGPLIVGDGRLARHFIHYYQQKKLPHSIWSRKTSSIENLKKQITKTQRVFLCISDRAIEELHGQIQTPKTHFVHFSGQFHHEEIYGFHPLYTFDQSTYPLSDYNQFYFIGTSEEKFFRQLMPEWTNNYWTIQPEIKTHYHALCTLAGNGTTTLWNHLFSETSQFGLPAEAFHPFLIRTLNNLLEHRPGRNTGPWYRKDLKTIEQHQKTLHNYPISSVYDAFLKLVNSQEQQ